MGHLTVDHRVAELLGQSKGRTEIRDPEGHVIGVYEPIEGDLLDFARANFNLDEARRVVAAGDRGISTQELLDRLKAQGV